MLRDRLAVDHVEEAAQPRELDVPRAAHVVHVEEQAHALLVAAAREHRDAVHKVVRVDGAAAAAASASKMHSPSTGGIIGSDASTTVRKALTSSTPPPAPPAPWRGECAAPRRVAARRRVHDAAERARCVHRLAEQRDRL